jgi:hypothetical protein
MKRRDDEKGNIEKQKHKKTKTNRCDVTKNGDNMD